MGASHNGCEGDDGSAAAGRQSRAVASVNAELPIDF